MAKRATKKSIARPAELPVRAFRDQKTWAAWLAKNYAKSPGLWIRVAKKDSGVASVTYPEAIETALCHGWIDGQRNVDNATFFRQKFTPRGKRSNWSQINRDKALALIEAGKMKAGGLAEVERAKRDGRWKAAYQSPSKMTMPRDLSAALNKNARAKAFFKTLDGANRYAVLFRVKAAKRPDTRARRIAQFVKMLAEKNKLHP